MKNVKCELDPNMERKRKVSPDQDSHKTESLDMSLDEQH